MHFATVFDKKYISRAKVMIDSLVEVCKNSSLHIYILCLDNEVSDYFCKYRNITLIELESIENKYIELKKAKNNRTYVEYIFTLSPFLPLYILQNFKNVKRITTIDADLFFLSDPSFVLESLGENKIGITRHNFPVFLKDFEKYGKYNVSFQSFPNLNDGINILNNWATSCIEYCSDHLDNFGRFADQKYLDSWMKLSENIIEFEYPVVGLAPWNIKNVELNWENGKLFSKNKELSFYHFHNIRFRSRFHLITSMQDYGVNRPSNEIKKLYSVYFRKIKKHNFKKDTSLVRSNNFTENIIINFVKDLKNQIVFFDILYFTFFIDVRFIFKFLLKFKLNWEKLLN